MLAAARIFVAFLLTGIALAGALLVHRYGHDFTYACKGGSIYAPGNACSGRTHPGWTDPVAIVIAFSGVGAAVAIARFRA